MRSGGGNDYGLSLLPANWQSSIAPTSNMPSTLNFGDSAAPAGGAGGGGASAVGSIAQGVAALAQIGASIANYVNQGKVMEAQARMQDNAYENQQQNALIDKEIAKGNLETQLEAVKITKEARKELSASAIYRQRAESQLEMEKVRNDELDKTEAAASINPEARKALSDFSRRSYSLGRPV